MSRGVLSVLTSVMVATAYCPWALAQDDSQLNFKIYSPDAAQAPAASGTPEASPAPAAAPAADAQDATMQAESPKADASETASQAAASPASGDELTKETPVAQSEPAASTTDAAATPETSTSASSGDAGSDAKAEGDSTTPGSGKVLEGYIRVVPKDTKVPIIMDTAVDSDTSQEGDEFAARTAEDLAIDGTVVVPAGSVIKGRIAQLNAPKHLNVGGSVALKFDTITTPDNRQIPLVANLVARGGVVHARRGLKDVAVDGGILMTPTLLGALIGAIAGNASSSSSIGAGGGLLIGTGIGAAVGIAVLLAKKGKKIDVRPGDELKINLAEDLRMPMM